MAKLSPENRNFRITFKKKDHTHWRYFGVPQGASDKEIEDAAAEAANLDMIQQKSRFTFSLHALLSGDRFRPCRVLKVEEYDEKKHMLVRGGRRFRLALFYLEKTYRSGIAERDEWYDYDGEVKKPS